MRIYYIYTNEKTNSNIMTKNTYLVTSFLLIGIVLLGSRYLGFNFIERLVSVFIVAGLFELIYRKKLKKWKIGLIIKAQFQAKHIFTEA